MNDELLQERLDSSQIVAALARRACEIVVKPTQAGYKDAGFFIVLRDEKGAERIEWLKERINDPHRKFGTVALFDERSFCEYFKVHGVVDPKKGTPIYGTLSPAAFIAVLNDHTNDKAGWRDHRAIFQCTHSPEWKVWSQHDRQPFNSTDAFALFIEENAPDFVHPDAAAMLNMALNFRITQRVTFNKAQRLQDGNVEFEYANVVDGATQNAAGRKVKIPETFQVNLRVWDGPFAKQYKVDARFRYRLEGGAVKLWFELVKPARTIEAAFKDLWTAIEEKTKATILYGSPDLK